LKSKTIANRSVSTREYHRQSKTAQDCLDGVPAQIVVSISMYVITSYIRHGVKTPVLVDCIGMNMIDAPNRPREMNPGPWTLDDPHCTNRSAKDEEG
jgi:hypothetical protein